MIIQAAKACIIAFCCVTLAHGTIPAHIRSIGLLRRHVDLTSHSKNLSSEISVVNSTRDCAILVELRHTDSFLSTFTINGQRNLLENSHTISSTSSSSRFSSSYFDSNANLSETLKSPDGVLKI